MIQKVSDYIADFLAQHHLNWVFSVVGGGAMHLNDSIGHHASLHVTYQHHEQACAMAADACARITGHPAVVCVTTGPGATNALTGVMGAYIDSIPMLVLSGQVRWATSIHAAKGLSLRTRGVQEFDIISAVQGMTKYCVTVQDPSLIRWHLEKALTTACEGRPSPCWLDIPLDVQAATVDTDSLPGYTHTDADAFLCPQAVAKEVAKHLSVAKRPVIIAGNGIRISGAHLAFLRLISKLNIPVVTTLSSVDAVANDHPCYVGRTGINGNRAANFAVQNSDLILSIGSRMSYTQTGFNTKTWAREAKRIVVDIDMDELRKDNIRIDERICANASSFIQALLPYASAHPCDAWRAQCDKWRTAYPAVEPRHYSHDTANAYAFFHELTTRLTSADDLIVSCGTARVSGSQASVIHEDMRFITNVSAASMGFDLPAATGVCVANNGRRTILVTGEGSLQMNLQELQTIAHHQFPLLIFVINNEGYHSIRQTQKAYFTPPLVGIGPESQDLSFPDLSKIAAAYGFPYEAIKTCDGLGDRLEKILDGERPLICELFVGKNQQAEPKVASRQTAAGQMVSLPLEDMAPFLPREELLSNMYIPLADASNWED